jgi:crotonobetainyl-CoA:carnitine CoA-transferase CaiB-like acyl-CoA transferase
MSQQAALSGLRVIECAGWNGVYAGRLLADAGADVVRIIPPSGDPLAAEPPFFANGRSIQEAWYNAGKRVVPIDLTTGAGQSALLSLLTTADILIEDWQPNAAPLTEAQMSAAGSALARVSVTPMGLDGPLHDWRTNDLVANALSGVASVTGNAETPPLTGYGNQSHHTVGLYGAICALAAHRAARLSGQPQHVDLSAHEAMVTCTEQVLMQWFFPEGTWQNAIAPRQGSLHWSGAYEIYPGKDGTGVMVTAALRFVDVLLPWLKADSAAGDLADPEKYPNVVAMIRDLPYVMSVLRNWVATYDGDDLFFEGQKRHQPFGAVYGIPKVLQSPQIAARGYLQDVEVPGAGPVPFPGRLYRTDADGPRPGLAVTAAVDDLAWGERARTPSSEAVDPARPLAGVRVMDFTHVLAGPFGTRVLADLGADVIKVMTGSRSGGANGPGHPYYTCWNRNKRSILLDMRSEEGLEVARALAAKSDIIIDNFSAGVLARWGLDRAGLHATNPRISVITMGGMGQDGPWKDMVTYAPTIHALTGLTYLTNPPGRHDLGYGFSLTDHLSGLAAALASLEALEHRERTGEGLSVDLSQYELGLGLMAPALIDCLANGTAPEPVGNRHPFDAWAPHGIYPAAGEDRWVAIAVRGDAEWRTLCEVIGRAGLAGDPRFATHQARIANQDALDAEIAAWTATRERYDIARQCQAAGIAAGPVQGAADLANNDPQLAARAFFTTSTHNDRWGEYGIDAFPARFNGHRPGPYEAVHELGEDTFDVATGLLGLGDAEFAELAAQGVFS